MTGRIGKQTSVEGRLAGVRGAWKCCLAALTLAPGWPGSLQAAAAPAPVPAPAQAPAKAAVAPQKPAPVPPPAAVAKPAGGAKGTPASQVAVAASGVNEIGILPSFKRGEQVPVEERNPYAPRITKKEKPAESGSEAGKIIQILESLRLSGVARDQQGHIKTVLLGDLRLSQGGELPQLLASQVDKVYVSKVTNEEVEFTWLTDAGKQVPDGRRISIKLDDRSKVEVILPGQPDVKDKEKVRALLVAKPSEED